MLFALNTVACRVSAFCAKGAGFYPGPVIVCMQLQHLSSAAYAALISCRESSTAYSLFSYGQSTFLQCYSVALYKRLFSGSVHTGIRRAYYPV